MVNRLLYFVEITAGLHIYKAEAEDMKTSLNTSQTIEQMLQIMSVVSETEE